MKEFKNLIDHLNNDECSRDKVALVASYLHEVSESDQVTFFNFFRHKSKRIQPTTLFQNISEYLNIPAWLIDDSKSHVGDLAETLALLFPPPPKTSSFTISHVRSLLLDYHEGQKSELLSILLDCISQLEQEERILVFKWITGSLSIPICETDLFCSLALLYDQKAESISFLFAQECETDLHFLEKLKKADSFCKNVLPKQFSEDKWIKDSPQKTGALKQFQIEWLYEGINIQVISKEDAVYIWAEDGRYLSHLFPEIVTAVRVMNRNVSLSGLLIVNSAKFSHLPLFLIEDIFTIDSENLEKKRLTDRQERISELIRENSNKHICNVQPLPALDWDGVEQLYEQARDFHAKGLIIRKKAKSIRQRKNTYNRWIWEAPPYKIKAAITSIEIGNRTDTYTLSVLSKEGMVPITKTQECSSLKEQFFESEKQMKQSSKQRFGASFIFDPEYVVTIEFKGIETSRKHKSGLSLKAPRLLVDDKNNDVKTVSLLESIQDLIPKREKDHSDTKLSKQLGLEL